MESDPDSQTSDTPEAARSRRALFGVAAAAATAAGAAVLTSETARAGNGDGQEFTLGEANSAQSATRLSGPALIVSDGQSSGSLARRVNTVDSGVYGATVGTDRSRAVWGQDETNGGAGVYGSHWANDLGTGVTGESFNGTGVVARGTSSDADFDSAGRIRFTASSSVGPKSAGVVGTITRDPDGSLWYCVANNDWRRLSARNSGGAFTPVSPARVYDSRLAQPAPGPLFTGQSRLVSVAFARDSVSGAVLSELVPADATAVSYNLTVDRTLEAGFLATAPGDVASTNSSAVNWSETGAIVSNAGVVKLDSRRLINVFCGGGGAATDFIIDVTGYYL